MRYFILLFIGVLAWTPFSVCGQPAAEWVLSPADTDKVEIDIRATYNGQTVQTGKPYVNAHGDTFYIDVFRIYISDISFTGYDSCGLTNAHLFDIADTNSYSFMLTHVPKGIYYKLQFIAGVDSLANTSGANGGDLDPAKGMYWAWNSGYIMAKLEGHSNACKTLHHAFEFHIGGFAPPYNTARTVTLKIPEYFQTGRPSLPTITLNADIATWMNHIDLKQTNNILTPGKEAMMMADGYSKMFSIESVDFTPLKAR